jgi:hypothetical protein
LRGTGQEQKQKSIISAEVVAKEETENPLEFRWEIEIMNNK